MLRGSAEYAILSESMPLPKEITDLLARYGVNAQSLIRMRFGGVVGKQSLVIVASMAVFGIIAYESKGAEIVLEFCAVGAGVIALAGIVMIGIHGHKHPLEATLEGGEIVAVVQSAMAAKGMIPPSSAPLTLEGLGVRSISADAPEQGAQ